MAAAAQGLKPLFGQRLVACAGNAAAQVEFAAVEQAAKAQRHADKERLYHGALRQSLEATAAASDDDVRQLSLHFNARLEELRLGAQSGPAPPHASRLHAEVEGADGSSSRCGQVPAKGAELQGSVLQVCMCLSYVCVYVWTLS